MIIELVPGKLFRDRPSRGYPKIGGSLEIKICNAMKNSSLLIMLVTLLLFSFGGSLQAQPLPNGYLEGPGCLDFHEPGTISCFKCFHMIDGGEWCSANAQV